MTNAPITYFPIIEEGYGPIGPFPSRYDPDSDTVTLDFESTTPMYTYLIARTLDPEDKDTKLVPFPLTSMVDRAFTLHRRLERNPFVPLRTKDTAHALSESVEALFKGITRQLPSRDVEGRRLYLLNEKDLDQLRTYYEAYEKDLTTKSKKLDAEHVDWQSERIRVLAENQRLRAENERLTDLADDAVQQRQVALERLSSVISLQLKIRKLTVEDTPDA